MSNCPTCKKEYKGFKNQKSLDEYRLSGMCQDCQDSFFEEPETKAPNGHCPNCGEHYYSEGNRFSPCCSKVCYSEFLASLNES